MATFNQLPSRGNPPPLVRFFFYATFVALWVGVSLSSSHSYFYKPLICALMLAPWLGICLIWRRCCGFDRNSEMMTAVAVIPLLLLTIAIRDFDLERPFAAAPSALALGLALATITTALLRPRIRQPLVFFSVAACLCVIYAASGLVFANSIFDLTPPSLARTEIVRQWSASGSGRGARLHYYLGLTEPVWPQHCVEVSHHLYDQVKAGQEICVRVHRGTLGWRWRAIDEDLRCP
jgi:hypothetical protein